MVPSSRAPVCYRGREVPNNAPALPRPGIGREIKRRRMPNSVSADPAARKKSPRKGRVPGGQRTLYISGSDWMFRNHTTSGTEARGSLATASSCTRSAPHKPPCRRQDASWSAGTDSYARPQMQTRMMETSRPPALARPWAKLRLTHEGARIWNISDRVKGGFSGVEKFRNSLWSPSGSQAPAWEPAGPAAGGQ